jgi:carbohydrate kinase (thermoresistant glucokinase family)
LIIVVMGVAGAGKSTLGKALAERLGCDFIEGDDYHPPANVEKMRAGIALDDADRRPWLAALRQRIHEYMERNHNAVVACSALKRDYRQWLSGDLAPVVYVYMSGAKDLIRARLKAREHHFMLADMLDSQLTTLEPPDDALLVPVDLATEAQVTRVLQALDIEV